MKPPVKHVWLRQLVKIDVAHTDLPMPLGLNRWAWMRQQMHRIRITDLARQMFPLVDVVLASLAWRRR